MSVGQTSYGINFSYPVFKASIGGSTRNYIAHILADGSADLAFDPNASGEVDALAVSGTIVYAGGGFTLIGGQARSHIAALNAGGAATAWDPIAGGSYPWVNALAVSGSTVYAGGYFTSIGGQTRYNIGALDATSGLATAWHPGTNGYVYALAVTGSTVYVGGQFSSAGGMGRGDIAALNATSGVASAWDPEALGGTHPWAYSLAVSGSSVYVGGGFTRIGGQTRNHMAALSVTSGAATAWNPNVGGVSSGNTYVYALAVSGSSVYAGGAFTSVGGRLRPDLARFSPTTGPWIGSLQPTRGRVGITLTITGWNFGTHRGTAKVYFGSKAVSTYVSWSATKIKVRVPTLTKGTKSVTVKTASGKSNAKTFTVI